MRFLIETVRFVIRSFFDINVYIFNLFWDESNAGFGVLVGLICSAVSILFAWDFVIGSPLLIFAVGVLSFHSPLIAVGILFVFCTIIFRVGRYVYYFIYPERRPKVKVEEKAKRDEVQPAEPVILRIIDDGDVEGLEQLEGNDVNFTLQQG